MHRQLWGGILMAAAISSLIITSFMLVQVWRLREPAVEAARSGVNLIGGTLDATSDSLGTVQQSLDATQAQIESLDQMTRTLSQSIRDTGPIVDSLKTLTGKDLPLTLQATEMSLNSAQSSAKLVDDVLGSITRIPFLPVKPYQPETPLNAALGQLSGSLDALNPSLLAINQSLGTASGNLTAMEEQIRAMGRNIQQMKQNIADVNRSVEQYRQTVRALRTRITELAAAIPGLATFVALTFSFILAWLIVTQVDMLIRGYALLRAPARTRLVARAAENRPIRKLESEEV